MFSSFATEEERMFEPDIVCTTWTTVQRFHNYVKKNGGKMPIHNPLPLQKPVFQTDKNNN